VSAAGEKINVVQATGWSMHPALRAGDVFLVERDPSPESLRAGDLVLFDSGSGGLVLHRFLAGGRVKGDRLKDEDVVPKIVGVARGRVLGGKTVLYSHPFLRVLQRLQALFSRHNRRQQRFHRVFAAATYVVGWTLRISEERILS
jgi:hypothetical protein